ncbi:hypothetical protein [Mycolicibacterium fortuitum]|uniref:hypothetical protein n=1 Tax=Mycolicibacterium fortuitum TaxID=1766 RepID=UPI0007EA8748|nr:hypothetical protein [Mycolicibacterium fortuitum]NOQ58473.1 hypothetical protein [Mycolicibacterium fortuitum]OBB40661.1 hypothetical protein A5754_18880 [Mycolicibacterium fortuitum]OBB76499.1 hypothetical protein A5755_12005 [Mycolicibacterium fortuitum]OBF82266.1 hypothetical protein A5751_15560 [Mycolicibacterium fortuitum]
MSVGRGWATIEADLRAELAAIGVEKASVYEKYGWLRADPTPWSEAAQAICDRAEERSETTCEVCGARPAERNRLPSGWIKTLCAWHRTGPIVRYRPGWQARVDRLVTELAGVEPTATVTIVEPTTLGPKGTFHTETEAGRELIWAALEELARTCGRCGCVGAERIDWCETCASRRVQAKRPASEEP